VGFQNGDDRLGVAIFVAQAAGFRAVAVFVDYCFRILDKPVASCNFTVGLPV